MALDGVGRVGDAMGRRWVGVGACGGCIAVKEFLQCCHAMQCDAVKKSFKMVQSESVHISGLNS